MKFTTASNLCISIFERCFLDPGFMRPGLEISLLAISGRLIQGKGTLLLETRSTYAVLC